VSRTALGTRAGALRRAQTEAIDVTLFAGLAFADETQGWSIDGHPWCARAVNVLGS
jgi:hypothetical protein